MFYWFYLTYKITNFIMKFHNETGQNLLPIMRLLDMVIKNKAILSRFFAFSDENRSLSDERARCYMEQFCSLRKRGAFPM